MITVAALYVDPLGAYAGLPGVDAWGIERDARLYAGPHPVVAHPPCQRWGRYWNGGPRSKVKLQKGDDAGCFKAALEAVRTWGGVLEHPKDSAAWAAFGLNRPPHTGGWVTADFNGGWTCCVYQGHYGHFSGKATWLYAVGVELPSLRWGKCEQRLPQWMIDRYGYEKARKCGVMAMVGGKDRTKIREATPPEFRDLLLDMARSRATASTPQRPPRAASVPRS